MVEHFVANEKVLSVQVRLAAPNFKTCYNHGYNKFSTGSQKAKYCNKHRKIRQRELVTERFKNTDLGAYKRKATEEDIIESLHKYNYDISTAMKSLGYSSVGGNTRRRFEKILDSMLTKSK